MKSYAEITHLLTNANSSKVIAALIQEACGEFGLDNYLYGRLLSPTADTQSMVVVNGYPLEWCERYESQNYYAVDPVVAHCASRSVPLVWDDIQLSTTLNKEKVDSFMNESRDFGLKSGATVHIHGVTCGDISALSFTSSEDVSKGLSRVLRALPFFQTLVPYIHEAISRIERLDDAGPFIRELSNREKECLLWTAEGKTSWETANILGVSERTVVFHLQNAAKKLKSTNRIQAVARATSLRLITPQF